jgi:hypothetical protein
MKPKLCIQNPVTAFAMPDALTVQKSKNFSLKETCFIKDTRFCAQNTSCSANVRICRKKVFAFCRKVTANLQKVLAGCRETGTFFCERPGVIVSCSIYQRNIRRVRTAKSACSVYGYLII